MIVHSRHCLPSRYRIPIVVFWLLPGVLFTLALLASQGMAALVGLIDPRWWGLLLLSALPALYIWREGVDVVEDAQTGERGLMRRIHLPRYLPFRELAGWQCVARPSAPGGLLTLYDRQQAKALECHIAHLTDSPRLLDALNEYLPRLPGR